MDPEEIAQLISEDTRYDLCPECGNKYATIAGRDVACPNHGCAAYDEDYTDALNAIEGGYIEIVSWFDPATFREGDFDHEDLIYYLDLVKSGGHYKYIYPPASMHEDYGEGPVMIFFRGWEGISREVLARAFEKYELPHGS